MAVIPSLSVVLLELCVVPVLSKYTTTNVVTYTSQDLNLHNLYTAQHTCTPHIVNVRTHVSRIAIHPYIHTLYAKYKINLHFSQHRRLRITHLSSQQVTINTFLLYRRAIPKGVFVSTLLVSHGHNGHNVRVQYMSHRRNVWVQEVSNSYIILTLSHTHMHAYSMGTVTESGKAFSFKVIIIHGVPKQAKVALMRM